MKRVALIYFVLTFFIFVPRVFAVECGDTPPTGDLNALNEYIKSCNDKISANKNEQNTLKSVITTINSKINLAQAQISQTQAQITATEKEIQVLSGVIDTVNVSMDQLMSIYIARVRESYRQMKVNRLNILFTSRSLSQFLENQKYISTVKAKDQLILTELEKSRLNYDQKKTDKIKKQQEIETLKKKLIAQKGLLDGQQAEKQKILLATKNDEKKFQALLAQARAELEAIEAIIAGKGEETVVGDISSGQIIAKVIQGPSCNSSGEHLHFIVSKDAKTQNPFSFLKSIDFSNCSGTKCGSDDGDAFNPSGSWEWPINAKVTLMQGYGSTWAVQHTWVGSVYRSHNGIDIKSTSSNDVKAVQGGKLYRGSMQGKNCLLKYVRVEHKDSGYNTYYLHVNYF